MVLEWKAGDPPCAQSLRDADGGIYGVVVDVLIACEAEAGYVAVSGDCDDSTAAGDDSPTAYRTFTGSCTKTYSITGEFTSGRHLRRGGGDQLYRRSLLL